MKAASYPARGGVLAFIGIVGLATFTAGVARAVDAPEAPASAQNLRERYAALKA